MPKLAHDQVISVSMHLESRVVGYTSSRACTTLKPFSLYSHIPSLNLRDREYVEEARSRSRHLLDELLHSVIEFFFGPLTV